MTALPNRPTESENSSDRRNHPRTPRKPRSEPTRGHYGLPPLGHQERKTDRTVHWSHVAHQRHRQQRVLLRIAGRPRQSVVVPTQRRIGLDHRHRHRHHRTRHQGTDLHRPRTHIPSPRMSHRTALPSYQHLHRPHIAPAIPDPSTQMDGLNRPCIACGEPSPNTRCDDHRLKPAPRPHRPSPRQRGYTTSWDRLSRKARQLMPFCADAHLGGCRGQLEADHSTTAWERHAQGLPIRLQDITVRCHLHNVQAGAARGTEVTRTD